jgi:hypothetical protein
MKGGCIDLTMNPVKRGDPTRGYARQDLRWMTIGGFEIFFRKCSKSMNFVKGVGMSPVGITYGLGDMISCRKFQSKMLFIFGRLMKTKLLHY